MGYYDWPLVPSISERFWEKVVDTGGPEECWLWTAFCNPSGYGMIRNGRKMALAHRVSWALAHGEIPSGRQILHRCDTPACVNPSHLYLGTNDDNMADKVARGRSSWPRPERRGEGHPLAKLTEEQVRVIRSEPYAHGSGRELARKFGVSPSLITHIRKREVWTHI